MAAELVGSTVVWLEICLADLKAFEMVDVRAGAKGVCLAETKVGDWVKKLVELRDNVLVALMDICSARKKVELRVA